MRSHRLGDGARIVTGPGSVVALIALAALAPVACGSPSDSAPEDGTPVVERLETEDGAPLVRNVSGSRWGEEARAVEEISIGVMEGDPDYMHGRPVSAWLEGDEIYLLDNQDAEVRVYDTEGVFLRRFGGAGEGPGEFEFPYSMALADGRVYVSSRGRITVFAQDGTHVGDRPVPGHILGRLAPAAGELWFSILIRPEDGNGPTDPWEMTLGYQRVGGDGLEGEPWTLPDLDLDVATLTIPFGGRSTSMPVPGAVPRPAYTLTPDSHLVYGNPQRYRFWIEDTDRSRLAVERAVEPVPYLDVERESFRRQLVGGIRQRVPDFQWDGTEIPDNRALYETLLPGRDGTIWVGRTTTVRRIEGCTLPDEMDFTSSQPCWEAERVLDAFSMEDGIYLGTMPYGNFHRLSIHGDRMVGIEEDELGFSTVKLYRIERPPVEISGRDDELPPDKK